jgi:predicted RNase H-like nuclease
MERRRSSDRLVVGADGAGKGWVVVALRDGCFADARWVATFSAVLEAHPGASVIGVDIPIGLPESGERGADVAARRYLGGRRSSVFMVPPPAVMEAGTYAQAREVARRLGGKGTSAQAWALRKKILEVAGHAARDSRIVEVHPEVSFRAMAGADLGFGKKTWNGLWERRQLLCAAGIVLPERLPSVRKGGADDVVDAAAAGWTADRVARGVAEALPAAAEVGRDGRAVAIWY